MDCPVCGCSVEPGDPASALVECSCCGTLWIRADDDEVERILVGAEG